MEVSLLAASDTIMASAPASRAGGAAAIEETVYELGAGLGVAVLGTITAAVYAPGVAAVPGVPPRAMGQARESLASAAHVAREVGGTAGTALLDGARVAFVSALHTTVTVSIGLLGVPPPLLRACVHLCGWDEGLLQA
ncbi:hypothetical protein AB0M95_08150 [Sphaerisporangium sp. NPDC051017]|uniref:hypothetical protein n=1 Tax=Sphaerisporangium sp. NPDC051017 TaxID=3154636 RepID=UPI0034497F9A